MSTKTPKHSKSQDTTAGRCWHGGSKPEACVAVPPATRPVDSEAAGREPGVRPPCIGTRWARRVPAGSERQPRQWHAASTAALGRGISHSRRQGGRMTRRGDCRALSRRLEPMGAPKRRRNRRGPDQDTGGADGGRAATGATATTTCGRRKWRRASHEALWGAASSAAVAASAGGRVHRLRGLRAMWCEVVRAGEAGTGEAGSAAAGRVEDGGARRRPVVGGPAVGIGICWTGARAAALRGRRHSLSDPVGHWEYTKTLA